MSLRWHTVLVLWITMMFVARGVAHAQSFGLELFNNVMPASGGMAGASIATPQDVQSAIYGNPASLTQYHGTHFSFSGSWIEPTYSVRQAAALPAFGVSPFDLSKSDAQGIAGGNIGVSQDFSALGMPVAVGLGLFAGAGAGVDLRDVPASNGTHVSLVALDIVNSFALDVTDHFSVGASITLTTATLDGPFVAVTGASSDYALRGKVGGVYELPVSTTVAAYWQTKANYRFENLVNFGGGFEDVVFDRPEMVGIGFANSHLMQGRLLLACDVTFQSYENADFLRAVYDDQWAFQLGAQYSAGPRARFRLGYAYNENPMRAFVPAGAGGVLPPGGVAHIQYIQAQLAAIPQHRVTGGLGIRDVLPGVDMDLMAGGTFEASETFGTTTASVESYWVGAGFTWRFGRGAVECGPWE